MSEILFKLNGKDVTVEDLLKEIYVNSVTKKKKIEETYNSVSRFITDYGTAVNLLPEVTKLQQVAINNDDQLIKLVAIVAKSKNKNSKNDDSSLMLDEAEMKQLIAATKASIEENVPSMGK